MAGAPEPNPSSFFLKIMSDTIRCTRKHNHRALAVGYIPTHLARIYVCNACYFEAQLNCYYVLRLDQDDNSYSIDFERNILAKHKKLRGTKELKFKPLHQNGNKLDATDTSN